MAATPYARRHHRLHAGTAADSISQTPTSQTGCTIRNQPDYMASPEHATAVVPTRRQKISQTEGLNANVTDCSTTVAGDELSPS
jgi:hypothetical protein